MRIMVPKLFFVLHLFVLGYTYSTKETHYNYKRIASFQTSSVETFTPLNCVPHKMFIYDHNICYCNDKGSKIGCKRKMYSTLYAELHAYHLQNLTMDCSAEVPGKNVIHVGCHKCICTDKNHATCVPSGCDPKKPVLNTVDQCIPGSILSDKCNGCICGENGKATCTNLDCLAIHNIKTPDDVLCTPNDNLLMECNECSCSESGLSISCEKVGCNHPNFLHKHLLNITTACEPKSIFYYDDCRKCACSRNGTYAMCNGVQCINPTDVEEEEQSTIKDTVDKCNPGVIFADGCNICICDKSGKGVCTTLRCDLDYDFKYVKQLTYSESVFKI